MESEGGELAQRLARAGVTEREGEVLSAIAERLRNREIAGRLHVSVRTVESHIASLLRKLDAKDRADLIEVGTRVQQKPRTDRMLPLPLTSLVGREHETNELTRLLEQHRLVTLIGPGGVGKTRLALRLAAIHSENDGEDVRLADMAPVGPELVADTMARALGVVPRPGWPLRDVLRDVAGGLRGLLLVDNCEHVVAETADIVADLMAAGTNLRVLTTSREPLGVAGEVTYLVPTLPVPTADASAVAKSAETFDAVRLFVDRAATASPGFVLTDALAPSVSALCERLDGLPLAIELAASRVRSFGPTELLSHLGQRFELLSTGARSSPPRHRTLRAAIAWSYELLSADERSLLERLAVFPGDFDFEAAEAMCADGALGGAAAITLLPRLVDKSLVSAVGRGSRRYRLLETIRAYAAEELAASGDAALARQLHASHYLSLAERAADGLRTSNQRAWASRLTPELANLRAALAHDLEAGSETLWRWVAALERYCDIGGHRREASEWIQRAWSMGDPLATPEVVTGLAAATNILHPSDHRMAFDVAQRAALLAVGLDDVSRARAARAVAMGGMWVQPERQLPLLREALDLFGADQPWETALTMQCLTQAVGDLTEALQWGRSSVELFRRVGDHTYAANTLFLMAQRAVSAGVADDEVQGWLTESRALAASSGSEGDLAHATVGFGQLTWIRGDHAGGAVLMDDVLPTLRRLGDHRCTGRALLLLGQHAREQGRLADAEDLLRASVEAISLAGSFILVNALEELAAVHAGQGHHRQAAVLLGSARALRGSDLAQMRPLEPPDDGLRESLSTALGPDEFEVALGAGESMSATEALSHTSP